jgi:hypothetical protein
MRPKAAMNFDSRFKYPPAIAQTLGFDLIDACNGTATIEIVTDVARHANPMGTVHGGVLCDVADGAIGTAHATTLAEGRVLPAWIYKSISSVLCGTTGFEQLPRRCIEAVPSADTYATFSTGRESSWRK